jgi:hypothetical protein
MRGTAIGVVEAPNNFLLLAAPHSWVKASIRCQQQKFPPDCGGPIEIASTVRGEASGEAVAADAVESVEHRFRFRLRLRWANRHYQQQRRRKHRECQSAKSHKLTFSDASNPHGNLSTVTPVILSASRTCPILASPTTEPGRRGWKRRLGSPISAPHFFALNLTHPDHSPDILRSTPRIE